MRIKSYFAASVQSAIAMARREFGDGVTLVTSHAAAPDSRHLGEYEVVFAIEDEEPKPAPEPIAPSAPAEQPAAEFTEFQQALMQAVVQQKPVALGESEKLEQIRELLLDLQLDPAMLSAVMTIIQQACGNKTETAAPRSCERPAIAVAAPALPPGKPAVEPSAAVGKPAPFRPALAPAQGGLSAAELAFVLAVENEPGKKSDLRR